MLSSTLVRRTLQCQRRRSIIIGQWESTTVLLPVKRCCRNSYAFQKSRLFSATAAAVKPDLNSSEQSQNNNNGEDPKATTSDGRVPIVWTTHRLKPEQIEKVDAIFHKVLWLDLFELSMLTALINERLGLHLTPKQAKALERQMAGLSGGGQASKSSASKSTEEAEKEAAPKTVDLKLTGFDAAAKIKVIKEVRAIAGLGLKEAKEMVESAPKIIQKDLKPEQAEELKAKLEAIGAQIELV